MFAIIVICGELIVSETSIQKYTNQQMYSCYYILLHAHMHIRAFTLCEIGGVRGGHTQLLQNIAQHTHTHEYILCGETGREIYKNL